MGRRDRHSRKAIRLTGPNASFSWWYAPAKRHWISSEYQEAYDDFRHAYVEGLWLTHLDQAYTLPFLGRLDEARARVAKLLNMMPRFTIREANVLLSTRLLSKNERRPPEGGIAGVT
jgi:hypothetical protein